MAKGKNPYFDDFITMIGFSCEAADFLKKTLLEFDPETLSQKREEMHKIEHSADEVKHVMIKRLAKEFVSPIEREDIVNLANELDNITDKIDDLLIRMYMYNIKTVRQEVFEFADIIMRCCKALQVATVEFPNFHKSTTLKQMIIDVNTTEEEGDALYIKAMRRLYTEEKDPIEIIVWSELFDRLEDCCDSCEHVADAIEIVAMKNS